MDFVRLKKRYLEVAMPELVKKYQFKSKMQVPKALDSAVDTLSQITGQKPVKTKAKKSIAGFKLREGMNIGCMVTLRGAIMYEFLDRFINIALPRVRDFKGVNPKGFDGRGNYNMSVKEQIIFPEIQFDKIFKVHGMNICIVTNTASDAEAFDLLGLLGMPYRKKAGEING